MKIFGYSIIRENKNPEFVILNNLGNDLERDKKTSMAVLEFYKKQVKNSGTYENLVWTLNDVFKEIDKIADSLVRFV